MTFGIRYNTWLVTYRGTYCEICANKSGNAEFASLLFAKRFFVCPNPVFSTGRERKTAVVRDLIKSGGKYE